MRKSLQSKLICVVIVSSIYSTTGLSLAHAEMGGMGQGMMNGGMKGAPDESAPVSVNQSQAKKLISYVQEQHLQCMQCHAVSKTVIGPSLSSVSARYLNKNDAMQVLSNNIAHGFGRMPPGLANEQQAQNLARLILELVEAPNKMENH